jgi:hypothetical protein
MLILPLNMAVQDKTYGLGIYVAQTLSGYVRSVPTLLARLTIDMVENTPAHRVHIVKHVQHTMPLSQTFPERCKDTLAFRFRAVRGVELVGVMPPDAFDYGMNAFLTGSQSFMGLLHLRVQGEDIVICAFLDHSTNDPQPRYGISGRAATSTVPSDHFTGFTSGYEGLWKSRSFRHVLHDTLLSTTKLPIGGEISTHVGRLQVTLKSTLGEAGFLLTAIIRTSITKKSRRHPERRVKMQATADKE